MEKCRRRERENNDYCEKVLHKYKQNPEGEKNEDQTETIFKEKAEVFRKLRKILILLCKNFQEIPSKLSKIKW